MRIIPYGAAGSVTGSCFLIETKKSKVLVDCGIFQGFSVTEKSNKVPSGINLNKLNAILLTHAHLDHSGRLPLFTKAGYSGPIYSTAATFDVAKLILTDSAHLQESETKRKNKKRARTLKLPLEPLYTLDDVKNTLPLFKTINFEKEIKITPEITAIFYEAGHLLGSASIELNIFEDGVRKRILFSGDLGPPRMPIIRDPKIFTNEKFDAVFIESTYGDRDHKNLEQTISEFYDVIENAIKNNGKILIPTFAVGRAQQLLYYLGEYFLKHKKIPHFPIYLDSPMAIEASALYKKHTELHDDEAKAYAKIGSQIKTALSSLKICKTGEESKALNDISGPCIIMAGAGMCNGGRILHHFKNNLWKKNTYVLICGFQADGSLGRRLVEGKKSVRIYGEEISVAAEIRTLGGFSAHAGQSDLLHWLEPMTKFKPRVIVIHGEDRQRETLSQKIYTQFKIRASKPGLGEAILL